MTCDYELYKELSNTKSQQLITDFVIKRSAVQSETKNANLFEDDSYSETVLRMTSDDNSE